MTDDRIPRNPLSWRRTLVAAALAVWLGGLVLYATIVVPVGAEVLGSHEAFGFVTRRVTWAMNHTVSGILVLVVLHHVLPGSPRPSRGSWLMLAVVLACQGGLYALHPWLDGLLDVDAHKVLDRAAFYERHRVYLLTTTLQWVAGALHFRALVR